MYVIKGGRGYVAKSGSETSYVRTLQQARKFKTKEEALANICPENEHILDVNSIIREALEE